jgi:hypothetical protein
MTRTLCFVLGILGASAVPGSAFANAAPAMRTTSKSLNAFAQCFVSRQKLASRPWWFVPSENGGTFSNVGSRVKEPPYFLRVQQVGPGLRLTLETSNEETELTGLIASINHCA